MGFIGKQKETNMTILLTFMFLIPLCAFLNRMRGTKGWCSHLYGGVIAIILSLYLHNPWLLLFYPLFIFGECFGWGALIGGVLENKDATEEQAQMLLSVRGAWWWGGNLALFAFCGTTIPVVIISIYIISLMFPLSVKLAMKFKSVKNTWALAEWIYGAVHGAIIALCISTIIK